MLYRARNSSQLAPNRASTPPDPPCRENNLIGVVTGDTYERLNVIHRWVTRGFLLLATIHFAVQNIGWDQHGVRTME